MRKDWIRTEEERTLRLLRNYHKEQRKINKLPLDHRSLDAIPIVVRKKKRIQPLLSKYKSQCTTPCKIELVNVESILFTRDPLWFFRVPKRMYLQFIAT